jgi:hypothetical protein
MLEEGDAALNRIGHFHAIATKDQKIVGKAGLDQRESDGFRG